jgi:hypothetical protein
LKRVLALDLLGIYRWYRKAGEGVYAEWDKDALQFTRQPISVQKWRSPLGFWAIRTSQFTKSAVSGGMLSRRSRVSMCIN